MLQNQVGRGADIPVCRSRCRQGLIGILCVKESCPTFKLAGGQDRLCFVSRKVPQRVLCNKDIRAPVYAEQARDPERRRHSAAVGRLLKRLHVRGLIVKVPRSRRWRVTEQGRRLLGDTLRTYRRYQAQAA
jgi:hypothetical protein